MQASKGEAPVRLPDSGEVQLPEPPVEDDAPADPHASDGAAGIRSLFDDFEALIDDARTYFDAELCYQKSRAGFVANRLKRTIAFGLVGAYFAVLATIALAVGIMIALAPLITAWGATAVVVLALLLVAWLLVRRAGRAWNELSGAMSPPPAETDDDA